MRAISTVVDATVFLLLVGAAVATVVAGTGGVADGPRNPAAEDARRLATETATVNYSLSPAARRADGSVEFHATDGAGFRRTAHGTLASLLADGAVGAATVDGRPLSNRSLEYRRAVRSVVESRLSRTHVHTNVTAEWEPYPGSPVRGSLRLGDRPPRTADVHAATVRPASSVPDASERARRAGREDGYSGVASVVSHAVVRGLFPPNATRLALRGDYPVDALTAHRYRRTARLLDAPRPGVSRVTVRESNDRLATALAGRVESGLRATYDSPEAAAEDVSVGSVRVTVRTWSA